MDMKKETIKGNGMAMAIIAKVLEHKERKAKMNAMKDLTKSKYIQVVPKGK